MGDGRMGLIGPRRLPAIGDLVICVDTVRLDKNNHSRRFIGIVLDKSITVYKIKIIESGKIIYWPNTATYLWKSNEKAVPLD